MSGQDGGLKFFDLNLLQHQSQEDNSALLQQVAKRRCTHTVPSSVQLLLRVAQFNSWIQLRTRSPRSCRALYQGVGCTVVPTCVCVYIHRMCSYISILPYFVTDVHNM